MIFKKLQLKCLPIIHTIHVLCVDQFDNTYRLPHTRGHNYADVLLNKIEAHIGKYKLMNCTAGLETKDAQTFLAKDIRAVNRWFDSYDDHMQLINKYCPADSVAANTAFKNKEDTTYFNSLANAARYAATEMASALCQATRIGCIFHEGYRLGKNVYEHEPHDILDMELAAATLGGTLAVLLDISLQN